jgi:sugar-specific transcriptional regulator TrmB|tara:strand:+ start:2380 stop:2580 length:201 start_codon:yes stop_codon:yes gene_type:complete
MGRAIDMENDIYKLKQEVQKLKEVLQEILNEVKKDEKKETNVKRSSNSNRKADKSSGPTGTKSSKS